jgi:PAS domain S-box-containing protein
VLKTLAPLQQEVVTSDQRWFLRRILPYRTQDNRIQGVVLTFHDITAIKAVQQQLSVREEQLRLVTNALPILISYLDRDTRYRYVNAGYERWFGMPAEQIIGRSIAEVAGEQAYRQVENDVRRVLTGERCSFDQKIAYADGNIRYVHGEYVPHWGDAGEVLGFYALVQDITDRKKAEQAVASSEREFRAIFELAGSGKTLTNPQTTQYIRVNRRFCEITGYSEQELLQKTYTDLTHPEDRAADRARVEPVLRGEQAYWTSEKRYRRKTGETLWVLVSGTLVRDNAGQPLYTIATIQDIDARKRAEQALQDSEERFRTLADNIAQLVWTADKLGWADWYNKRWYDYTGTTFEEMTGRGWEKLQHPDHLERVSAKLQHCVETGSEWEDVFPLRGKDGNYRWFLSKAVPIRAVSGAIVRWFGSNTDITEQMQMEAALKEADQRKDEFLATLAHELRNPLAPLRTGLELLELAADEHTRVAEVRAMMQRQVSHLTRLVDDLLDVSRITRGKVELRRSRVDLQTIVQHAVETVAQFIAGCGHELSIELPAQPVMLDADPVRLAQVFANLLHNAGKYTPRQGQIRISARLHGQEAVGEVVVSVKDTGIGIPADKLERVFTMFMQLEHPAEQQHSGLGIGLTLVKLLVDMHAGRVYALSDGPGRGSEFVVHLPLAAQLPAASTAPEALPAPAADNGKNPALQRILVVDDNKDAANSLGELLQLMGHEVRIAYDGLEALDTAAEFHPHAILLDLGMPKLDGYAMARRLRAQPWGRRIRLIALTGWGQNEDKRLSREAGIDYHLVKPVDIAEIRQLIAGSAPAAAQISRSSR